MCIYRYGRVSRNKDHLLSASWYYFYTGAGREEGHYCCRLVAHKKEYFSIFIYIHYKELVYVNLFSDL